MIKNVLRFLSISMLLGFVSCSDDNTTPVSEKQTGYVIHTTAGIGAEQSHFVQFFDEMPSGSIDNTRGISFPRFFAIDVYDNYVISGNISGAVEGVSQVKFDVDGKAFESAFLPTTGTSASGAIKDAETAYVNDFNSEDIIIYNPTTMQSKGIIDMSVAFRSPSWTGLSWQAFVIRDNDLFFTVRPGIEGSGSFYATDSAIVYHIDLITETYQGVSAIDKNGLISRTYNETWVDEQGNIYLGSLFGDPGRNTEPSILKIPAGSTSLDPNYDFKFVNPVTGTLSSVNLPIFVGNFVYHQNGKGYSVVSTSLPQALLDFIAEKGSVDAILNDPVLVTEAFALLSNNPNGQFVEIDLEAQNTTIIDGPPLVDANNSFVKVIDGSVYLMATGGHTNAVYEYDPATRTITEVFNITSGGRIADFYKIGD
ncbi:MAG: hypothetical protein AAGI25_18005 [Bacteroidota bacterium]